MSNIHSRFVTIASLPKRLRPVGYLLLRPSKGEIGIFAVELLEQGVYINSILAVNTP